MSKQYGIKVMISADDCADDWIWVTEDQLQTKTERDYIGVGMVYPILFEDYWEAEEAAKMWKTEDDNSDNYVKVVEYKGY
jgi:hypothetical protein